MKKFIPLFLVAATIHAAEQNCKSALNSMHIDLRHSEGTGVGYSKGYSTVEGLFMPSRSKWGFYPFLDIRWHIFNSGRFATNGGIGARFLRDCRILGGYVYYDWRQTRHKDFNQFSTGFESLGRRWDFTTNGYFIIGSSKSPFFHFRGAHARVDLGFTGIDAESAYHFLQKERWDLFLAAGPYFYASKFNSRIVGGRMRLGMKFYKYFWAEGRTSYDQTFRWRGQGQIGIIIPISAGRSRKYKMNEGYKLYCDSCDGARVLRSRLAQPPAHTEMIVVSRKSKNI